MTGDQEKKICSLLIFEDSKNSRSLQIHLGLWLKLKTMIGPGVHIWIYSNLHITTYNYSSTCEMFLGFDINHA